MKKAKEITLVLAIFYFTFNVIDHFILEPNPSSSFPSYVYQNLLVIEKASNDAFTEKNYMTMEAVEEIVEKQSWTSTPWPYELVLSGTNTEWTVVAKPIKRPIVSLIRIILFWDIPFYPTFVIDSRGREIKPLLDKSAK